MPWPSLQPAGSVAPGLATPAVWMNQRREIMVPPSAPQQEQPAHQRAHRNGQCDQYPPPPRAFPR